MRLSALGLRNHLFLGHLHGCRQEHALDLGSIVGKVCVLACCSAGYRLIVLKFGRSKNSQIAVFGRFALRIRCVPHPRTNEFMGQPYLSN